jgi:hypothetical protein
MASGLFRPIPLVRHRCRGLRATESSQGSAPAGPSLPGLDRLDARPAFPESRLGYAEGRGQTRGRFISGNTIPGRCPGRAARSHRLIRKADANRFKDVKPSAGKEVLLRTTEFARKKLCHFRQSERIGNLAVGATEFTAACFYEHEAHGLVALRAGRWRGVLGHVTLTLDQGGST